MKSEIIHEGEFVKITYYIPAAQFIELVKQLHQPKKIKVHHLEIDVDKVIAAKKKQLFEKVAAWKEAHPGKYPNKVYNDFMLYWAEATKKGTAKIRYDEPKYFEIGKRLATFWGRLDETEKSKAWQLEKCDKNNSAQVVALIPKGQLL